MIFSRKSLIWLGGIVLAAGLATGAWMVFLRSASARTIAASPGGHDNDGGVAVKTIRPKRNPNFRIAIEQLATVEPFFQAGLRSRVAGVVQHIWKDIGERVRAGELLVDIDVPDLQKEVEQKASIVEQRRKEWKLAGAHVKTAEAAVKVAQASIRQREAEVIAA